MSTRIRWVALVASLALVACSAASSPVKTNGDRGPAVPLATVFASSTTPQFPTGVPSAVMPTLPVVTTVVTQSPDRLVAPSINLDAQVVATDWTTGGNWTVPNGAAGWLENSAYPGQAGNTVLAGHHNTQGEVFRYLSELKLGAVITVMTGQQQAVYSVTERLIVPMWNVSPEQEAEYATWIDRTRDTRLTLVTCWPYYTNSHRVIVIAKPVGG